MLLEKLTDFKLDGWQQNKLQPIEIIDLRFGLIQPNVFKPGNRTSARANLGTRTSAQIPKIFSNFGTN